MAQSAGAHVAVCTSFDLLESLLCELTAAGRTVIDHPPAAACWPAADRPFACAEACAEARPRFPAWV